MASEKTSPADINALAAEVMDLWQEHLQIYAADPQAKAELMKMLEPQRQLFADWSTMMQNGLHGASAAQNTGTTDGGRPSSPAPQPHGAHGPATAPAPSDDGALRLAQLAHRMAELEKRMAKLEARNTAPAKATRRGKAH
jgi:hypothetical protein